MTIDEMEKEFAQSGYKVIVDLQKKCAKLEEENKSLKMMLEGTVPLLETNVVDIGVSNERIICETQIAKLKNKAVGNEELTLEETRKLQIYVDILETLKQKKDDGIHAESIPESQLLELIKNEPGQ